MRVSKIDRRETGLFKEHQLRLAYDQKGLSDFIGIPFSKSAFRDQIKLKQKSFTADKRKILTDALHHQYDCIKSNRIENQIRSLNDEKTFTITTGHQLSVFTGPLFFIVKILHAIKLSDELNARYPKYKFVPVYWMATEDHDYMEIKSFNLFNKTITWETDQTGAVGRFDLRDFDYMKSAIREVFENHPNSEITGLLENYKGDNLAEATRNLVHYLFEDKGLLIVDGDDRMLKREFSDLFKREINEEFSYHAVKKSNEELVENNLPKQVYPREINLFYLGQKSRGRIEKEDEGFKVSGGLIYTKEEMLELIENYPERFSPNAILRPLYQELILPNLAYVGGAGEMTYWLQLKGVFDQAGVPYPLIQVRNSVLWIDKNAVKKMQKVDLNANDLFKSTDELKRNYLNGHDDVELDFNPLDKAMDKLKVEIDNLISSTDSNLLNFGGAEFRKIEKTIDSIKSRLVRSEKSKHERAMKIIEDLKEKLFPDNGLQERYINFFSLSADGNYTAVLDQMYNALDPFSNDFIIIEDQ